ncbi:MAG: hypothetical protein NTZ73_03120 [Candidatus Diapherotrites archaeon]|nr:hypothetical protein [Candidatus Diapherotrites archaeon]
MKRNFSARILLPAVALLMLIGFANAEILISLSTDRKELLINEIGILKIKVHNDSGAEIEKIFLKMESGKTLRFLNENDPEEQSSMVKTISPIGAGETKELALKVKIISLDESKSNIFVYYGEKEPLENVIGTVVTAKESAVSVKGTASKKNFPEGQGVFVDFMISAPQEKNVKKIMAELRVPQGFTLKSQAATFEDLGEKGERGANFEAVAPQNISGEQKIFLAYGYMDESGPHYFEKKLSVFFEPDYSVLFAAIGAVIFIIAAFLYISQGKGEKVSGSAK